MHFVLRYTAVSLLLPLAANAAPPVFRSDTCAVTLNAVTMGTALTPGNASLRNTVVYEPFTRLYHWWGFAADDANWPSAASSLRAVVHATSRDGNHFVSDSNLSYAFGSASYTSYGASNDPPLDFFRAAYSAQSGTWKMFSWTENVGASVGQYNYNTSANDLGSVASTTQVLHQGPLSAPGAAGNHVGTFGLVDGVLYLRLDGGPNDGGAAQYPYTDSIQPTLGAMAGEADLYTGTPYCWFLNTSCGNSDARVPSYVHNVGRTLRQADGKLGTYYTFRNAATSARLDKQIWYVESADNGMTWSLPVGVFADGGAVTIEGQPVAVDTGAGQGNFSGIDVVARGSGYRAYFNTRDTAGNFVMVSTAGRPSDALFFDGFGGCFD